MTMLVDVSRMSDEAYLSYEACLSDLQLHPAADLHMSRGADHAVMFVDGPLPDGFACKALYSCASLSSGD